jgi:DNA-binding transcriptional ArsR family regulator
LTCNYFVAYNSCMDKIFKALADATRRQLLDRLFENNGQTLSQLCRHMEMSRQAVTRHLDILETANLVVSEWKGREKLHYLNPVPISEIYHRWIAKYEPQRLEALHDLKIHLEKDENE